MSRVEAAPGGAWFLAGSAVVVAGGVALGAALTTRVPVLIAFVGWTGVAILAAALVMGRVGGVGWGLGVVAGAWAVSLVARPDLADAALQPSPVLVAPGLLVAAELAYWSLEPGTRVPGGRLAGRAVARRAGDLVATALATAAGSGAVLGVGRAASGRGFGLEAIGVTAVLLLLSAIVALAGRLRAAPQ